MSDKMSEKKKCSFKCTTCQHYNKINDYCREKDIKHCKKQTQTDFSQCSDYLINNKLVMFFGG